MGTKGKGAGMSQSSQTPVRRPAGVDRGWSEKVERAKKARRRGHEARKDKDPCIHDTADPVLGRRRATSTAQPVTSLPRRACGPVRPPGTHQEVPGSSRLSPRSHHRHHLRGQHPVVGGVALQRQPQRGSSHHPGLARRRRRDGGQNGAPGPGTVQGTDCHRSEPGQERCDPVCNGRPPHPRWHPPATWGRARLSAPRWRARNQNLVSAKDIIAAVESAQAAVAQNPDTYPLQASLLSDVTAIKVQQARSGSRTHERPRRGGAACSPRSII